MIKSTYKLVILPSSINQDNLSMSLKDVQYYFDWYMSIKDDRLVNFYKEVFNANKIEFSFEKLQAIFYFLKDNIKTRQLTLEEIEKKQSNLPNQIKNIHPVPNYEFIEPTHSIIFDIGIYFAEFLREEIPGIQWTIEKDKKMINYGRPVLVNKDVSVDLSPQWLIHMLVIQLNNNTVKEDRLVELYKKWKGTFQGKQKDYLAIINSWGKRNGLHSL